MRQLIILSVTLMLVIVSGIAHSEEGIITQQELEQREKDIQSGVAPRATLQTLVGCVSKIFMHVKGNTTPPKLGAHFYVGGSLFGIQYNGIYVGGYAPASLTPDQMAGYGPLLAQLQYAADKKVKVQIHHVDGFAVYVETLYTQPCP